MKSARSVGPLVTSAIGLVLLAGCAVTPRVEYHALREGIRKDNWVLFRLTDSVIAVGGAARPGVEEKGPAAPVSLGFETVVCNEDGCGQIAAAAAPSDYEGALYALEPRSKNLIETRLTPTYQTNSLRLKVLSVEAKDHRLEAINTIGAIATGVAKATTRSGANNTEEAGASSQGFKLRLPFTIDLAEARCETEAPAGCISAVVADPANPAVNGAPKVLPENPDWVYGIRFLDNPRASGLVPRSDVAGVHGAMVASICRPMMLELSPNKAGKPVASLRVLVADPDWLMTAPFPTKGGMTFTGLCGLDVQADAVTTVGADALATAFFNNVAAVRATQKK